MHLHTELPTLRATLQLNPPDRPLEKGKKPEQEPHTTWYDVKFYPYTEPGVDPVFAVTGGCYTLICRCVLLKNNSIEIIRSFKDDDDEAALNSVVWSQADNGDPLVCVTGSSKKIKILNVKTGQLVHTLTGHGDDVGDLAVSPTNPNILASASSDHTVCVWSLDNKYRKQPLAVKCFGDGHKEAVITIAWHRSGRYLLSGGLDTKINLWVIPELPDNNTGTDKPTLIHYPHFSTSEVHVDFVDCIQWYNDLIFSHAVKENKVVLWSIDNFNGDDPPPPHKDVPIPGSQIVPGPDAQAQTERIEVADTRSAWGGRFQRLLQFELPKAETYYLRFRVFFEPGYHAVLAAGNQNSTAFFWDLQKLEESNRKKRDKLPVKKLAAGHASGLAAGPTQDAFRRVRESSSMSNASAQSSNSAQTNPGSKVGRAKSNKKDNVTKNIDDPFTLIKAHEHHMIKKYNFTFRQLAWSRDGQWCVGCGEYGMIVIFHRWKDGIRPESLA